MSNLVRVALDRTLVPLVAYLKHATAQGPSVIDELHRRSIADSADYAARHMAHALTSKTRPALWDFALAKAPASGLCAEFGVWNGGSINHFAAAGAPARPRLRQFRRLGRGLGGRGVPQGNVRPRRRHAAGRSERDAR